MKALVLGGTGFIGSHLVDLLLARGHQVRVLSRSPERHRPPLAGVDYRLARLGDTPAVAEALCGVEVVFHLAGATVPATAARDPVFDVEANLVGTLRLLGLLAGSGVKRLVYLSSGGTVYGVPETLPVPEDHCLMPICSYGIVKAAIEGYVRIFQRSHDVDCIVVRPSNPYGPRQGHFGVQGVIGTFLGRIRDGEPLEVWGDGSQVRDFLYVSDLAEFCLRAAEKGGGGVYNCGSGQGSSINDVIAVTEKVTGREVPVIRRPARGFDVPEVVLDISAARRDFGFQPRVGLEEGIRMTWESLDRGGCG